MLVCTLGGHACEIISMLVCTLGGHPCEISCYAIMMHASLACSVRICHSTACRERVQLCMVGVSVYETLT
jgi:hypothetical protein